MSPQFPLSYGEKKYKSLDLPHNYHLLNGLQSTTDFNKPISVKSKQWGHNKINLNKLKVEGPFAQYASLSTSKTIVPPTNLKPVHVYTDFESKDPEFTPRDLIEDLLKPKEFHKVDIKDSDRQVTGLNITLLDHQVLGLEFLLHRETRKAKQRTYLTLIDSEMEKDEGKEETDHTFGRCRPGSFFNRGGILADDMGLGKTVQMMALILKHKSTKKLHGTTLIVCPLPLISQWDQEFSTKTLDVKVLQFHGSKRTTEPEVLFLYDVVITSYATLASESEKSKSPLYAEKFKFYRIVLDEAHTIKNSATKNFKACAKLDAKYKWCLTGTPIQNKIDELHSLLKFLSINKYENDAVWNAEIGLLMKSNNPEKISSALSSVHKILDKIMIRRSKQILLDNDVMTVTKTIHREILDFTPFEKEIYTKLEMRVVKNILGSDVVVDQDNSGTLNVNKNVNFDYVGALTYLLRLRQLCCHWELLFYLKKQSVDDLLMSEFNKEVEDFGSKKQIIGTSMIEDNLIDDDINALLKSMKNMNLEDKTKLGAGVEADLDPIHAIKLRRVMKILKKDDPKKPRKTIIFSEFVSMLNIIASMLYDNGINYIMYHGQMDKQAKEEALIELRKNPRVHVLLCSLKSGAYGLNITSCSRVILYEPFWNPAIGAQAIDRAYRIGQKDNVDVHEFFVSGTVEMRIQKLQDKKRELANAVVDKNAQATVKMLSTGLSKFELLSLLGINTVDKPKVI